VPETDVVDRTATAAAYGLALPDALLAAERAHGGLPALTVVDYGQLRDGVAHTLTYRELDMRSRALAVELQERCGSRTDCRAVILCPHGIDYAVAFLGCLYAGVTGVPLYAPEPLGSDDRLRNVLLDSEPDWVLTTSAACEAVVLALSEKLRFAVRGVMCVDTVPAHRAAQWSRPDIDESSIAYLQYTSGSTGAPSGVCVTYRNLAAAAYQLKHDAPWLEPGTVAVNWVPYFHDLGLVGGLVMPLSVGAHAVHLSPTAFVQEPYRWLELISRYRAAWTATPNFGLDLCVRRSTPQQRAGLDLRSLRAVLNGSEPVRDGSWTAFAAAFARCGLNPYAHSPGYGLAEATLGVTNAIDDDAPHVARDFDRDALARGQAMARERVDDPSVRLVSCGVPLVDVHLSIVDPDTRVALPDGQVGEVWVRGPAVAAGYWRQPARTEKVFGGRLRAATGPEAEERWLCTGDLGFVYDGLLYITGRRKEVLIVAGRNHYPADLEMTAERAHPGIRPGGVAAFTTPAPHDRPDGEERVVVVVEVRARENRDDVVSRVRAEVAERHGCPVNDVVLVRPGAIPRTTSRKVRRGACRDLYMRGALRRLVDSR
jgi:long-chain fatty acid adenylase/transferase FadD26